MTILLEDENIPVKTVRKLSCKYVDIIFVSEVSPGLSDREVFNLASVYEGVIIKLEVDIRQFNIVFP